MSGVFQVFRVLASTLWILLLSSMFAYGKRFGKGGALQNLIEGGSGKMLAEGGQYGVQALLSQPHEHRYTEPWPSSIW